MLASAPASLGTSSPGAKPKSCASRSRNAPESTNGTTTTSTATTTTRSTHRAIRCSLRKCLLDVLTSLSRFPRLGRRLLRQLLLLLDGFIVIVDVVVFVVVVSQLVLAAGDHVEVAQRIVDAE